MNEYPSFILFNFEYVHTIIVLCRNLSYNFSHFTNGITIFNRKSFYQKSLKILDINNKQNTQKYFKANIDNIFFRRDVCFVLKLSWYSKGLHFTNGITIFNYKSFYQKSLKILDINDKQNMQKYFKANIDTIFFIRGVCFVPPMLVREH